MHQRTLISTLILSSLALAGCGGGSSSESVPPATGGTVNPPVTAGPETITVGTITGFGSVFINGKKFQVNNNTIVSIEGKPDVVGDDSPLAIGMKVKVKATQDDDTLTANSIEYDDDIKGTIESITLDANDESIGVIVVLGQEIVIDENTAFDDDFDNNDADPVIDIRDLVVGMTVEISGYPTDTGFIATYIALAVDDDGNDAELGKPDVDDDEFELKGTVEALAEDLTSITVNGIEFVINESTVLEDVVLDQNLVGAYVEIEADLVDDIYIAREIEAEDLFDDDDDVSEFEIEGVLQAIDAESSPATITINGQTIAVNDISLFTDLVGLMIEVEGEFNSDNVLVVEEVEVESEPVFKLEDTITEIDSENNTFTTRLGVIVSITDGARLEDDAADEEVNLTAENFLSFLSVGDLIKASADARSDDSLSWTKIKRLEQVGEFDAVGCQLTGAVEDVTGDADNYSFSVQGITVNTSQAEEFEDSNGNELSRSDFFEILAPGLVVSAESIEGDAYCTPGLLEADEVEVEDDD